MITKTDNKNPKAILSEIPIRQAMLFLFKIVRLHKVVMEAREIFLLFYDKN